MVFLNTYYFHDVNNRSNYRNTFCHQTGDGTPNRGWSRPVIPLSRMGFVPPGPPESESPSVRAGWCGVEEAGSPRTSPPELCSA